ncbi:transporter associated domain protein [Chlamydia ibidis]|uniref:Transporter associated domain protein n=2 Tax=Chlamydia ibidis TaxID=1405396 RepID=S7J4K4_9CHLA|nr:hemolysin family protein [Chlamydia ibidis]EPP35334.1 transporter associated domain protein [Chlamydia ibidis]EQM62842.1 CBS domain protein [Chlamydia ibidis 10-1398/6]
MIYILLAIFSLALAWGTTLTQKTQDDSSPRPPSNTALLLSGFLLTLYGILGGKIYQEYYKFFGSFTYVFWLVYVMLAPIAYGLLPYSIGEKHANGPVNIFAYLSRFIQSMLSPLGFVSKKPELQQVAISIDTPLSEAICTFDKLIVREVMIPKVDIFALQEDTPIKEAFPAIMEEGYSRIPVYKKDIDNITGVILVKDLLKLNSSCDSVLPISSVAKPPLYAPEIKKASSLLQEFRQKHRHLAIIVNEYGFTEGIVTMEDIIEEIFGEISDEYDVDEDIPYKKVGNSWIVDGRMNISDAEEYFNITIQHENSYDTLGGHVFHKVGAVPKKGMKIHHENFDIEIITCSERSVGKLKITPRKITS